VLYIDYEWDGLLALIGIGREAVIDYCVESVTLPEARRWNAQQVGVSRCIDVDVWLNDGSPQLDAKNRPAGELTELSG